MLAGALLRGFADHASEALTGLFTHAFERITSRAAFAPQSALEADVLAGVSIALPLLVGGIAIGALASAVQVGGLFAPRAVSPDPSQLDPTARFGAGGTRMGATTLLTLVRFALVIAAAFGTFLEGMPGMATLSRRPPGAALDACIAMTSAITLRVGVALVLLGVLDAVVERALYRASLRMTRRERERERRDAEGDAGLKRERERIRDAFQREGELEDVRGAALVLTDGDALAIALTYDASDVEAVPSVAIVTRGARVDEVVREAREHAVPRIDDAALANELAILSPGTVIPEALYERVARAMRSGA
jgi:flagellar biosynthetic protein FlhB